MEDLVESILDYVRSDYTDYAIMINGEWGVGKTHFWNNKIRKKRNIFLNFLQAEEIINIFFCNKKLNIRIFFSSTNKSHWNI